METLESFYKQISCRETLTASELIPYFAYFVIKDKDSFQPREIQHCFTELNITPYSNIPLFLSKNASSKSPMFIKTNNGYRIHRKQKELLQSTLQEHIEIPIENSFFNTDAFKNTRYYLEEIASQMCRCYSCGLYDACLVLMRKLLETLIIECFERFGINNEILNTDGHYFSLSELIPKYINNTKWVASKNIKESMKTIKKYGDLSAHNRRFLAKKSDLDNFKFELRQTIQELVLQIDYPKWTISTIQ